MGWCSGRHYRGGMTLLEALGSQIDADRLITDPDIMASYIHDDAEWAPYEMPVAVVRPRTAEQVQTVVQACIAHGAPVVTRGAGTGLSGGANAVAGGVVIAFDAMNAIKEINTLERLAVVEPGVVNDHLRDACAEHGLWYPPDPASAPWSTIGGNVATNAGGLCCVKYGVTKDYVLGMQVVTGTGELVRLGRRTAKGVAGFDLSALMVGSEGTLGVITEVTVKLRPQRDPERTIVGYFDSIVAAGKAVEAVAADGLTPSALELIDRQCLLAVDAWKNMGLSADAEVVLLGRIDTPGEIGDAEAERMLACFKPFRGYLEREIHRPGGSRRPVLRPASGIPRPSSGSARCSPRTSVSPRRRFRRCWRASRPSRPGTTRTSRTSRTRVTATCHPLLITPHDDEAARRRAQAAFAEIIDNALELGGTVTGEHGVGLLKMGGLAQELSPAVVAMHHAIKGALDPHGIMNPGKVI